MTRFTDTAPARSGYRWRLWRIGGTLLVALMFTVAAMAESSVQRSASLADRSALIESIRAVGESEARRIALIRHLLVEHRDAAGDLLGPELAPAGDPVVQRAIATALLEVDLAQRRAFFEPLLSLLGTADERLQEAVALAIGEMDDEAIGRTLIQITTDPAVPAQRRIGAITALACDMRLPVAGILIELIGSPDPAVRSAAFAGLRRLTARSDLVDDPDTWRRWWTEHRDLSPVQWQSVLVRTLSDRNRRLAVAQRQLEVQLVEALRMVYLSRPPEARSVLLVTWLAEPFQAHRMLAMELAAQRLIDVDAPPLQEPVLEELRAVLEDPSPQMRRRAAEVLSEARDVLGARIIARRLDAQIETDIDVLRANLRWLRHVPQPEAVAPVVRLLDNPPLASEAADALAEAVGLEVAGLTEPERAAIAAKVSGHLAAAGDPSMIRLLGRIAAADQAAHWQVIAGFLDSSVDTVKDAAARAWAESNQPLSALAGRAHDPVIQPFLYDAAVQHGRQPGTLYQLVRHRPQAASLRQPWQRALLALAKQVQPDVVLGAVRELMAHDEDAVLHEALLSTAIARLAPLDHGDPDNGNSALPAQLSALLVDLLLVRAQVRLSNGQAKLALATYQHLTSAQTYRMTPAQQAQCQLGCIRGHLALGQVDEALALAGSIVTVDRDKAADQRLSAAVLDDLLGAVSRSLEASEAQVARRILAFLQKAPQQQLPDGVAARIKALQARLPAPPEAEQPVQEVGASPPVEGEPTRPPDKTTG